MLQQILRDLYVDPEILAELDDQQKQSLFCKMREEQVRRWKAWNEEIYDKSTNNNDTDRKKSVSFMKGSDGEPWVWVMGEHQDDKSIEEILREEAEEKARKMARKEAEEITKRVTLELMELDNLEISGFSRDEEEAEEIYCSVEELKQRKPKNSNYSICHYQSKNMLNLEKEVLHELSNINKNKNKVVNRIALWEKKLTQERTCQILKKIQQQQAQVAREAEEGEKKQEELWMEQERKAKQAEKEMREIARRAREEYKLSKLDATDPCYSTAATPLVPPGRQAVIQWFRSSEIPKDVLRDPLKNIHPWFHGLITRKEAESLLMDRAEGDFLIRLSEKIWGYAVSYRAKDKCKHYLVNSTPEGYSFLGNNQIDHKDLCALIAHHRQYPLTAGGEKLGNACPRKDGRGLDELFDQ